MPGIKVKRIDLEDEMRILTESVVLISGLLMWGTDHKRVSLGYKNGSICRYGCYSCRAPGLVPGTQVSS